MASFAKAKIALIEYFACAFTLQQVILIIQALFVQPPALMEVSQKIFVVTLSEECSSTTSNCRVNLRFSNTAVFDY